MLKKSIVLLALTASMAGCGLSTPATGLGATASKEGALEAQKARLNNDTLNDRLIYAARYEDLEGVNKYLAQGANPNSSARENGTTLTTLGWAVHGAVFENSTVGVEIVKRLLKAGAKVNGFAETPQTPLDIANADAEHYKKYGKENAVYPVILKLLKDQGAKTYAELKQ